MPHAKVLINLPNLVYGPTPFELLGRAFDTMLMWQERQEERRRFLRLDDRMLRDIGLTRDQACELSRRPFWRG